MINNMRFNTALLHSAAPGDKATGATLHLFTSPVRFIRNQLYSMKNCLQIKHPVFLIQEFGNPTIAAFEDRMTVLEGGMASVACASGMAAVSCALLNITQAGERLS